MADKEMHVLIAMESTHLSFLHYDDVARSLIVQGERTGWYRYIQDVVIVCEYLVMRT